MTSHRLRCIQNLACAGLLMLAGASTAHGQFMPGPGQNRPSSGFPPVGGAQDPAFPPPPGQGGTRSAAQDSAFPPPPGQGGTRSVQDSAFPPPPGQGGGRTAAPNPAFAPPPQQGGFSGGPVQSAGFPPPNSQQSVCMNFLPIRKAAEEGAAAIRAAGERKAAREEVCTLFKRFAGHEAKLIKFLVDHKTACGIPPQAISSAQSNHNKTLAIQKNVCSGGPAVTAPTLSDALGGPIIADDNSAKQPGTGTFNTLTGNVLSR